MDPFPGFAAALTAAACADGAPGSSSTEASAQQCARGKAEADRSAGARSAVESVEIAETPAAAAAATAAGGVGERARAGSGRAGTKATTVRHTDEGEYASAGMGVQGEARLAELRERLRAGEMGREEGAENEEEEEVVEEEEEEEQQRPPCVMEEEGEGAMAGVAEQRSGREAGGSRGEVLEVAVRRGLVEQVQRKLRKAVESPSQRAGVLRQLFTDIAFELDGHAHDVLLRDPSASLSSLRAADSPAPALNALLAPPTSAGATAFERMLLPREQPWQMLAHADDQGTQNHPWQKQQQQGQGLWGAAGGECERVCFYEVLAQHYADSEASVAALLPLFAPLWSCVFSSQIFALLLHRWLYSSPKPHSEEIHRYTRAFMTGVEGIFWIDLQSNEQRFRPLFNFVMEHIVMDEHRFALVPPLFQKDMFCTVARCFFLYQSGARLPALLAAASRQEALHGATADIFVTELTNQLQRIKVEPVLLLFLHRSTALKGLDLRSATAIRLQVALHSMAVPGGPLFPTRPVRRAARSALDTLYPVGRMFRHIISFSFRILHPLYWPTSLIVLLLNLLRALIAACTRIFHTLFPHASPHQQHHQHQHHQHQHQLHQQQQQQQGLAQSQSFHRRSSHSPKHSPSPKSSKAQASAWQTQGGQVQEHALGKGQRRQQPRRAQGQVQAHED
ncbi:hypothetical protein CLOM_g7249 [Closterium sp. NIES-68]|nr:hypothetical protein CLOM_g7249 [Closterium sp. NIES-68]GJP83256.1 hypothetical protein CLOP_g13429 [Closterium sp. NIES-67]